MTYVKTSAGFSPVIVVIGLSIFACICLGGRYVWLKDKNSSGQKPSSASQAVKAKPPAADIYKGWKSFSNATYGIGFKYPPGWKTEEVDGAANALAGSSVTVRFAVNIKRSQDVKYNDTAAVEVLNEGLESAVSYYDGYYAQSSSNKVTKTVDKLKGRQGAQYVITNNGNTSKAYLFSVGDKTYEFSSINEELNIQTDPDYWVKFDRTFDSLQIK